MKPCIGITSDFNPGDRKDYGGREATFFLRGRYVEAVRAAGGIPFILPCTPEPKNLRGLLTTLHGIVLPGSGPDIDPRYYGEQKTARFTCMSKQRTEFEMWLIKTATRQELPLLGLCGGMQMMNVAFGGKLFQDIPTQIVSPLQHRQPVSCEEPHHPITVVQGTLLAKITRVRRTRVNSSHHQAIKQTGAGFRINATASDGVIEGIEHLAHPFLLGVQWHPEFLYSHDPVSKRIFRAFLTEAQKRCR